MGQKPRSSPVPAIVAALLAVFGAACGFSLYRRWDPWVEVCRLTVPVERAAFSRDERQVATWQTRTMGQAFLWDARTGDRIRELEFPERADHLLGFSPDLGTAVFEGRDPENRECTILRFASGEPGKELPAGVDEAVFSPDGATVATIAEGNGVKIWNVRTGELIQVLSTGSALHGVFLPDGRSFLSFESFDGERWGGLILRDVPGNRETWRVPLAWVTELKVSSDGRRILAVGSKGAAWIVSTSTGEILNTFSSIGTGDFVPESDLLLSANGSCLQGILQALDSRTGKVVFQPPWKIHVSRSLTVSPSGKHVLLGNDSTGSGQAVLVERRRPENLWGIARLWEVWALLLVACGVAALAFSRHHRS